MSDDADDETAAWQRALTGDGAAFAALFRLHRGRVFSRARTLVDQVHDAEDVTATAFFELWRKRRSVRLVDGSTLPWLLTTTLNLARNQRRGHRRYGRLIASLPRDEAPDAESVAIANLEIEVLGIRLSDALARLSSTDADLLVLTALDGLTVADAAAALGMKPGAARMRLHRARERLQTDLGEEHRPAALLLPKGDNA